MFYFSRIPFWIKWIYPGLVWTIRDRSKSVYLTFDDGPHPEITPWVMDQLDRYDAKATFFLIGERVERYPEIVDQILQRGHTIGNHSYDHPNGWKTDDRDYFKNVEDCARVLESDLFRPPYGRIKRSQARHLKKTYKIIMWDVVSGDFDTEIDAAKCTRNVKKDVRDGSIVVFHDSEKALPRLEESLPEVLRFLKEKSYQMPAIRF